MKRPDVCIRARADVAVLRLAVEQARTPRAEVTLDPAAVRELIRELELGLEVILGTAVTQRTEAGEPVAWREVVGFSLSAFAPAGTVR